MTIVVVGLLVLGVVWFVVRRLGGRRSVGQLATVRRAVLDGAVLVDVRTAAEYGSGHIPGALSIPLHQLTMAEHCLREKTAPVVVYCNQGVRSRAAVEMLQRLGFVHVHDLGCMENVERLKLPFEGRRAPRCELVSRERTAGVALE